MPILNRNEVSVRIYGRTERNPRVRPFRVEALPFPVQNVVPCFQSRQGRTQRGGCRLHRVNVDVLGPIASADEALKARRALPTAGDGEIACHRPRGIVVAIGRRRPLAVSSGRGSRYDGGLVQISGVWSSWFPAKWVAEPRGRRLVLDSSQRSLAPIAR